MSIRDLQSSLPLEAREYFVPHARAVAIIAHPYGPLGGSQDDHVVCSLARHLQHLGVLTVTFNFSRPTSWTGVKERNEYRAVLHHVEHLHRGIKVLLCGYSYGSLCLPDHHGAAYVLVSPLLPPLSTALTLSRTDMYAHVKTAHRLVVWGDKDNFTGSKRLVKAWPEGKVVPRGNHFWRDNETMKELKRHVTRFVEEICGSS